MNFRNFIISASVILTAGVITDSAHAQAVPSSADASRMSHPDNKLEPRLTGKALPPHKPKFESNAKPANANEITLQLARINLVGETAFKESELAQFWRDDIGKTITLNEVYAIADRITRFYQEKGYILARAFIPAQEIEGGAVTIQIAEGKIGDVRFEGPFPVRGLLADAIADMRDASPLQIKQVERWTLHLNDFYGAEFHVVFKNAADLHDPAIPADSVVLVLIGERKQPVNAALSFDNSGSRYLGPNTVTASTSINYGDMFFQHTQLSYTTSVGMDELHIIDVEHDIPLSAKGVQLVLTAQSIEGRPGYTLDDLDIHSESRQAGVGLEWTPIRQRDQVLTLRGKFEVQNNATDILDLPFTIDRLRSVRLSARYEMLTGSAVNAIEMRADKGFDGIFGASKKGDIDLSRAEGRPGFVKYGASLSHHQRLPYGLSLFADATGQLSTTPLLSSEEFGYGGNAFGRAYDPSEIVGDKGFSAAVELRYESLDMLDVHVQPFAFYDFGKVWNLDPGQPKVDSGASAGLGARMSTDFGAALSFAVAKPLTRSIETPQAYEDDNGPRFQFNFSAKY